MTLNKSLRGIIAAYTMAGIALGTAIGVGGYHFWINRETKTELVVNKETDEMSKREKLKALEEILGEEYDSYYNRDYKEYLERPDSLELATVLGDRFNNINIDTYIQFLQHENAVEFIDALDNKFSKYYFDEYNKLVVFEDGVGFVDAMREDFIAYMSDEYVNILEKGINPEDIRKAREILQDEFESEYQQIRILNLLTHENGIELVGELGENYDEFNIEKYGLLLEKNVSPETIASFPSTEVGEITDKLRDLKIPEELLPHLTPSLKDYSIIAAGRNPVFGTDVSEISTYLQDKIKNRENCHRENADYSEKPSQEMRLLLTQNINILYLIKGYVDYFDNPQNVQEVFQMIEADIENPYSEEGFLVVDTDTGYQFIRVNERDFDTPNLENNGSYIIPEWFNLIGHIGVGHFHATYEDCTKYCGPSGWPDSTIIDNTGDLGLLINSNKENPYQIDIVITKLEGDFFNVDIYYRDFLPDVVTWEMENNRYATVLDLGIFGKDGYPVMVEETQ